MNRKSQQSLLHAHPSVGKHPDRPSHPALAAGRGGHAEEPSDHMAGGFSATWRRILWPCIAVAAGGLLSVTVSAAAAYGSADPTALIPALSAVSLALTSLSGGLTAGLCYRERAFAASFSVGGILTALLCLIGLFSGGGSPMDWLMRLIPLAVCTVVGFLTRKRPQRVIHTHRAGTHPALRN